jgi:enediyne biosynthesis protein E4
LLSSLLPLAPASEVRTPLAKPSAASAALFAELDAAQTGLAFTNAIDTTHPMKFLFASSMSAGGVAIGDFDADGKPDLFLVNGPGQNKLFRQSGEMKFTDVTAKAGVDGGDAWAVGCAMADVNGDGKLDLYVCNYLTANQLFINNGDGTFTDKAKDYHLDLVDACHTPTFCDYDGDGKLDLYVLTNRWYVPGGLGFPTEKTIEPGPGGKPTIMPKWEKYYDAVQVSDSNF